MKSQIKLIHDYFKQKILAKDFEIVKIEYYKLELIIDNEYTFYIWLGNIDCIKRLELYIASLSFMLITFTEEEKKLLYELLSPIVFEHRKNELGYAKTEISKSYPVLF